MNPSPPPLREPLRMECPRCRRILEYRDVRPSFCSHCGQGLMAGATTAEIRPGDTRPAPTQPASGNGVPAPETVGRYRLLRPLGEGGMGTVYEAEDSPTGQRVALKLLSARNVSDSAVERFRQEGRLASRISHPRCVFVLGADEDHGWPYIAMELMPGHTLEDLVKAHGPLEPEQAVAKVLDVLEGLQEAHRLGVLHRDVKPSNCFLTADGRVKIGDFGLSKSLLGEARLTQTGTFLGTPLYASPEQVRGEAADARTDVYSLTATLFFLLTGKAPFEETSVSAVLANIVSGPQPSVRGQRPEVPRGLERVVLRGLERNRERRLRDLEALRTALLPFAPGQLRLGSRGVRIAAYLLDWLFLQFLVLPGGPVYQVAKTVAWFAYFVLLEGLLGASLGKRILRLRVSRAERSGEPGIGRAFLRTAAFYALLGAPVDLPDLLPVTWTIGKVRMRTELLNSAWLLAGAILVLSTMRARNGYRGLHEVLSGTRCSLLARSEKQRKLRSRPQDLFTRMVASPAGTPRRVGPFEVRGTLRASAEETLLLGTDPALGREVLIWLRPLSEPPLGSARRDLDRPARARWVAGGQDEERQWDVFLVTEGSPLNEVSGNRGALGWPEFRPIFEQVSRELIAALADGTLPRRLSADQVLIGPRGNVVLLDTPLQGAATGSNGAGGDPEESARAFLLEVASVALEGPGRRSEGPRQGIRAPVPTHAARILDRLASGGPSRKVGEVLADLEATRAEPALVTSRMRLEHAGGVMLAAGLVVFVYILFLIWASRPQEGPRFVLAALPLVFAVSAFATRGGVMLRLVRGALVGADGRPASRWRCAARSLLVWAPFFAPVTAAAALGNRGPEEAQLYLSLAWLALFPVYLILSLVPKRLLQDRLTGTYLVPR